MTTRNKIILICSACAAVLVIAIAAISIAFVINSNTNNTAASTNAAASTQTANTATNTTAANTTNNTATATANTAQTTAEATLEQQKADFNARAQGIINLAYEKLSAIDCTPSPGMVDSNGRCTGQYVDPLFTGCLAPWQDEGLYSWKTQTSSQSADEFVELIDFMRTMDGRTITGAEIIYQGFDEHDIPVFRVYTKS